MGPKDTSERVSDMFRQTLVELLNPRHDKIALRLNQRPRKTLGFQTPAYRLSEAVASTG
jgi:IS30 family transposase